MSITLKPDAKPCIQPPRKLPLIYEKAVEEEIKALLRKKIIEPVEDYSRFQSSIVVVSKKNNEIHLCVDMRLPNQEILKDSHPVITWEQISAKLESAK